MRNHNPEKIISEITAEIVPEYRYDGSEDFKCWQKKARAKLSELLGFKYMRKCDADFKAEYEEDCGDYIKTRFSFQSELGYYIPGYVLMPKNIKMPVPVMLCLQGHSKGMQISIGEPKYEGDAEMIKVGRDFAVGAIKRGYCAVVIEQRYMGECGGDSEGPGCCANGREGTASAVKSLLVGRSAVGERVWDVSRTIDVICDNFKRIDPNDISCMGNSGGGTITFYAACIDERIKYAIPSCSVCTYLDSIINIYHCPCNYIPSIARYFDMGDLGGLIAPRGLVVVAGKHDPIFPLHGVSRCVDRIKSLYKEDCAENRIRFVIGDGGHQFYPNIAYSALNELRGLI